MKPLRKEDREVQVGGEVQLDGARGRVVEVVPPQWGPCVKVDFGGDARWYHEEDLSVGSPS